MQRVNPNSSIRRGYSFEDLFVLKIYADWLKSPDKFYEVQIQYVPDELNMKRFSIDDVVVIDQNGNYFFHQLKYKQHPNRDLWSFDELINKGLIKWIESFEATGKLSGCKGYLVTNGHPAEDVGACMVGSRLEYSKLGTLYPNVLTKLKRTLAVKTIKSFFSNFHFEFSFPDLNQFEREIRNQYYYDLKATKNGVDSLLLHIAKEGSEPYPQSLTLHEIRELLSWDRPRPLNQNFEVPSDFEFFDKSTHEAIVKNLADPKGGIQVIIGKPGTGKSTYLSKLYQLLKNRGIPIARHHYHLNPKDTSFRERLNSERVKEALRAEFKKEKEEILGVLSYQNTEHIPLNEFIEKIAAYYAKKEKCFALIVDGLDHVLREGKSADDLREFLNEILYPQKGFYILIGTQEMAVPYLPNVIYQYCSKENWIEIKGLSRKAVEKIVLKHKAELNLHEDKETIHKIIRKVFEKTAGNPLHLRYVLTQLVVRGGASDIEAIEAILPYKKEIKDYYEDLWRQLSPVAKSICFGIAFLDFRLQEEELLDLARYFTPYPAEIYLGYNQIRHLIKNDLFGISVYHNSFMVFLLNHEELLLQKKAIYVQIRDWLKSSSNEDLKWSEIPKIEYYLGNDKPLMELNREWVINNFIACRDEHQIEKLLHLAAEAAFLKSDYKNVIQFRILENYFANRRYNLFETLQKIWVTAFGLNERAFARVPEFSKFNHYQLKEILLTLLRTGKVFLVPDEVIDRFNDFLHDNDYEQNEVIKTWIEILAAFESKGTKDAYDFIVQGRREKFAPGYFAHYCASLVREGNRSRIEEVLKTQLHWNEKLVIAEELAIGDLLNKSFSWKKQLEKFVPIGKRQGLVQFYFIVSGSVVSSNNKLPSSSLFPEKVDLHSRAIEQISLYEETFFNGLFLVLNGQNKIVKAWISQAEKRWPVELMTVGLQVSTYLGSCILEKQRCDIVQVLSFFDSLEMLDYYDDHDIYELRRVVVPYLIELSLQLHTYINIHNSFKGTLSKEQCSLLLNNKWLYKNEIISLFTSKKVLLSDEGFEEYRNRETARLSAEFIPFKDRAERLVNLAILAKGLDKKKAAEELVREAAQNIIAYGNHKDMLLYSIMRSIEICHEAGSKKVKSYIRQIAKYIYHITDLTDGDETSSFIYDYGQLLEKSDPGLLYNLYFDALEQRQYNLTESLFGDILSTIDLSTPLGKAIAGTSIEQNPYNSLLFLSRQNSEAKKVVNQIQSVFGRIDYTSDRGDGSRLSSKKEKEKKVSYNHVLPDDLESYFNSITGKNFYHRKHEQSDFLLAWVKYWLNQKSVDLQQIINPLSLVCESNYADINEKVFDYIYPYALKVKKQFAFKCAVWAFANSSSWSEEYIRKMTDARKRWLKIIEDFPEKKIEFFEKSIRYSGNYYGSDDSSHFIPIPKATQFFVDCGQLEIAESFTEAYLKSLELLFPGLYLCDPSFITNERTIHPFEILITRFHSVSPLARERAGWHLAELLEKDHSEEFHQHFLNELSKINLEMRACNFLLIIIKSMYAKESFSHKYLSILSLAESLSVGGRAIELLMHKIGNLLGQSARLEILSVISVTHQRPLISEEKFIKKLRTYLPLAYEDYLKELQEKSTMPIWEIWYNIYDEICNELNLIETQSDQDYGNSRRDYITARTTIFSDVLRSSFFKLLDYLSELWIISNDELFHYTLRNFPIDPSIWNIKLSKKPKWWPRIQEIQKEDIVLKKAELISSISKTLSSDSNYQLLHLSGAISPPRQFYEDTVEGTIHILPFAFKKSSKLSDARKIYSSIEKAHFRWYPKVVSYLNFGVFENELGFIPEEQSIFVDKTEIIPLVGGLLFPGPHMWQYFRWRYHFRLLSPLLATSLKLDTSSNFIQYLDNKKIIAKVIDFADGLRDRAEHQKVIPSGNYITISKEYLNEVLRSKNLKLAYVVRQRHSFRHYSFSKEKEDVIVFDILYSDAIANGGR